MTDEIPSEQPEVAQPTESIGSQPPVAVLQPVTPPGWYPDAASGQKRWWDGSRWTDKYQAPAGGHGTAALVLGIIALVLAFIPVMNWIGLVLGLIALIVGAVGLRSPLSKSRSLIGLILGGIAVVLAIILGSIYAAVIFSGSNAALSSGPQPQQPAQSSQTAQASPSSAPTPTASPTPLAPALTAAQQQAVIAAQGYISDGQGFSYQGLIDQLDSPAGNGFAVADATFAVNSLNIDFNAQAVIAAKGYIASGIGFSHASLVEQLSSPYGGQFTPAQAEYAVTQVGL